MAELLGDVGGLSSALKLIGMFVASFFSNQLFNSSILSKVYQSEKFENKTQDKSTGRFLTKKNRKQRI